ncbi:general transcription factor IIF subunit 1 [Scleropages formosus]|uniref:general transcription factor IIF subunit 1 n=1 Tax=Scleropages formosus TaxID=113540 RepID=UPI0008787293|nr:general transcription factor IIF subunit 1 [Scleropages formosus]
MTSLGSSSSSATEYIVRVPKNTSKRYSIMAFNAGDKVNCSTWTQARMERDMSNKRMYSEEETVESGAGSEFGKKQREEARRKKFGIVTREFRAEDQPWILKVNGKAGRRFKGQKKGGVTENASYYIFTQCPDGAFEAFPVHGWYNFTPQAKHRTLTAEEAEEEWGRRNKVVNHFSIMLQRRLREQERGEDEEEDGEKAGKKKKKKKGDKGSDLRIHDLDDDLEISSDDSDSSLAEDGESKPKVKKENDKKGKGKKKKRKKGSDSEALEDSDDGDFEGLEVDYMSDESSSEEEEQEKLKPNKGDDVPKGIDEASESEEESEEERPNEEEGKEEAEEEGKKTPVQQEKKKRRDSSEESDSSEDSDIDGEASSALFMVKKRTPPKRAGGRGSGGSSRTGSRPGTPSMDSASTSNTLRAAASKLEQGKRQTPGASSSDTPAAKRLKMEPSPQSPSGKATPQPTSGKSTPSSSDVQLTEDAVRRYLIRKPMTTKDLLKKFQTKRTGLSSEQTVNVLAQILKRLNPERKNINDKMHFYLTE